MMRRPTTGSGKLFVTVLATLAPIGLLDADDWPSYQRDSARSAVTSESLAIPLESSWTWRARTRPRMAWPGPAHWDGYNKVYNMKDRMTFDRVFHVAAAGDAVYFGSSIDDRVHCLDAATGKRRWAFYTEGPVRLAPTVSGGRVYVGSDDGFVYCLEAASGTLEWKQQVAPERRRVPGNGRIISRWPVRTGVVVVDGMAYCGAGVFPSEACFLAAFDAKTGERRWRQSWTDVPAQGYMLASPGRLYVTTGRDRPLVFDRGTGKRLYQVEGGGGGTYALLVGNSLLYGPGKEGEVSFHSATGKDQLASFRGNHMIVTPQLSYLHTDTTLSALDRARYVTLFGERKVLQKRRGELGKAIGAARKARATPEAIESLAEQKAAAERGIRRTTRELRECSKWKTSCDTPLALILAGETLFTGGPGVVAAYRAMDGTRSWSAEVQGGVFGLAVANGRLFASTDTGAIVCFEEKEQ